MTQLAAPPASLGAPIPSSSSTRVSTARAISRGSWVLPPSPKERASTAAAQRVPSGTRLACEAKPKAASAFRAKVSVKALRVDL